MELNFDLVRAFVFAICIAVAFVPTTFAASTYLFIMTCNENQPSAVQGFTQAGWNWTVNGQPINGGGVSCSLAGGGSTTTGGGTVPPNVNGIGGGMFIERGTCHKLIFDQQSFTPSGVVSFSLRASCDTDQANGGPLTITASFALKV